jgi:hypothetical protein
MRFVSQYGAYRIQLRPQIAEVFSSGDVRVTQEGLYASFERDILMPHEREIALGTFSFRGQYQERDEVRLVEPDYRLSVWDSDRVAEREGWTPELKAWAEERLLSNGMHGIDYIHVPALVLAPPWPTFDSYRGTPENLVKKLVEDGHDLEEVLAYELEHKNRERFTVAIAEEIKRQIAELQRGPAADEVLA